MFTKFHSVNKHLATAGTQKKKKKKQTKKWTVPMKRKKITETCKGRINYKKIKLKNSCFVKMLSPGKPNLKTVKGNTHAHTHAHTHTYTHTIFCWQKSLLTLSSTDYNTAQPTTTMKHSSAQFVMKHMGETKKMKLFLLCSFQVFAPPLRFMHVHLMFSCVWGFFLFLFFCFVFHLSGLFICFQFSTQSTDEGKYDILLRRKESWNVWSHNTYFWKTLSTSTYKKCVLFSCMQQNM